MDSVRGAKCARCKRTLRSTTSVKNGMGPKCYRTWSRTMQEIKKERAAAAERVGNQDGRG